MAQKDQGLARVYRRQPQMSRTRGKSLCCLSATMRHVVHPHAVLYSADTSTRPNHAFTPSAAPSQGSDLSTNSASVRDWANRLMAKDPKVRATAEATLVQGAPRSLPLLRRFLNRPE